MLNATADSIIFGLTVLGWTAYMRLSSRKKLKARKHENVSTSTGPSLKAEFPGKEHIAVESPREILSADEQVLRGAFDNSEKQVSKTKFISFTD